MAIPICPVTIENDGTIQQPINFYSEEDYVVWRELFTRQIKTLQKTVVPEFLTGLKILPFNETSIPNVEEISKKLYSISKFHLVCVGGLISSTTFFEHLANRRFTVGWFVRSREQMDYLEEPDLFHDLFGHVPLLTNPVYTDFMQKVGLLGLEIANKFKDDKKNLEIMSNALLRIYWFTVEFGLMKKDSLLVYGAGIASSFKEIPHALFNNEVNRIFLDNLERVVRTTYFINDMQNLYFVISSFEQMYELFDNTNLLHNLIEARNKGMLPHSIIYPNDNLISIK